MVNFCRFELSGGRTDQWRNPQNHWVMLGQVCAEDMVLGGTSGTLIFIAGANCTAAYSIQHAGTLLLDGCIDTEIVPYYPSLYKGIRTNVLLLIVGSKDTPDPSGPQVSFQASRRTRNLEIPNGFGEHNLSGR